MRVCENPRYRWLRMRVDGKAWRKICSFLELVEQANSSFSYRRYLHVLEDVERAWAGIETSLPLLDDEGIELIVKMNVGKVNFVRCTEIAEILASFPRPLRFTFILDDARKRRTFRQLEVTSFRKVLSRYLGYLVSSGLVVKTCYRTVKGANVGTLYFRLFRMFTSTENEEGYRKFFDELRKLISSFERSCLGAKH